MVGNTAQKVYGLSCLTFRLQKHQHNLEPRPSPPKIKSTIKTEVYGDPDFDLIYTSHIERQNGSLRQWCKRLTHLTYAFSKKWENLVAALALHFAYYNFCRVHKSLKTTPAMAAGIRDRVWSISELLAD